MGFTNIFLYINNIHLIEAIKAVYYIRHHIYTELVREQFDTYIYRKNISYCCKHWLTKYKVNYEHIHFLLDKVTSFNIKNDKVIIDFEYIKENDTNLVVCSIIVTENNEAQHYAIFDITNTRIVIFNKDNNPTQIKPPIKICKLMGIYSVKDYYSIYRLQQFYIRLYKINFTDIYYKHILNKI